MSNRSELGPSVGDLQGRVEIPSGDLPEESIPDLSLDIERSSEGSIRTGLSFGEYVQEFWMPVHLGSGRMALETEENYRTTAKHLAKHAEGLPEGLQAIALEALGRRELAAFSESLLDGLSASTVALHLRQVLRILQDACTDGLIAQAPDGSGLIQSGPERCVPKGSVWTPEEVSRALTYARKRSDRFGLWEGHAVHLALLLLSCTGMRKSELFALTWPDVEQPEDDDGKTIVHVRRQVLWAGSQWKLVPIRKPEACRRFVIDNPQVPAEMRKIRKTGAYVWTEVVLANLAREKGPRPYGQTNCPITKRIRRAAIELGITRETGQGTNAGPKKSMPKTVRGIRHFYAVQLLKAGKDPRFVAERLGHANPAFTRTSYAWAIQGSSPEAP